MLIFVAISLALHLANADLTMKVICDDQMTLWVDGVQTDVAGQGSWNQMSTLGLKPGTRVLGIKCLNTGGPYGIMGAITDEAGNDVLVTDNSWSCSNTADAGWETAGFVEGDNWNPASYYPHRNYVTNSGSWSSMSANRQIIWTDTAADRTVYCRKVLAEPLNWGQYAEVYLSGYSSGVAKFDTLAQALAACPTRSDCGGITYEPYSNKYTLRQGSELKPSPSKEVSWKMNPYATGSGYATTVMVKDLGCWKDTASRAIAPVEGQFPQLQDSYQSRENPLGKCLSATMCLGNSIFSLQNGGWCATTADAADTYQKFGASDSCKDDGQGGPWGNQVYQVNPGVSVSDLTMKVICDDQMTLWVDGVQTDVAGQGSWNQMSTLTIPSTTQVLGIKCLNTGGPYGIMGAVTDADGNDVLVTDNSWSCSNTADDGWEKADFKEGDGWNSASYYPHRNYVTNSGSWASMSANRQIIWTGTAADRTVYCRKVIQRPAVATVKVESLGCWKDTANRAIAPIEGSVSTLSDSYIARSNSFDKCLKATMALGNKVFSLQNGGWCATAADAGDTYQKYGPIGSCKDDGEGGPWGNQVYRIAC